jgi:hypothetical protein
MNDLIRVCLPAGMRRVIPVKSRFQQQARAHAQGFLRSGARAFEI